MDGDVVAGLVLSRICFWALPNPKTGKSKLTVYRDGKMWLAKSRPEWLEEARVTDMMLRRVLPKLEQKGLIQTARYKHGGSPKVHIWLDVERLTELEHAQTPAKQQVPSGRNNGLDSGVSTESLLRNTLGTDTVNNKEKSLASDDAKEFLKTGNPFSGKTKNENPTPESGEEVNLEKIEKGESELPPKPKLTSSAAVVAALSAQQEQKATAPAAGLKGKNGMLLLWKKRMSVLYEDGWKEPTGKEIGQMGQLFVKLVGLNHDPIAVLDHALQHWSAFAYKAKTDKALGSAPVQPLIGFILSHYDSLLQLIAKSVPQQPAPSVAKTAYTVPKVFDKPKIVNYDSDIGPKSANESPKAPDSTESDKPSEEQKAAALAAFYKKLGG
jgi:hypothetical protein